VRGHVSGEGAILDPIRAAIYTFDAPVENSLGSPIATTQLTGTDLSMTFAFFQIR
jgi:hypothetical protein